MRILYIAALALPLSVGAAAAKNDVEGISRAMQEQTLQACAGRIGVATPVRLQSLNASSPLFVANGRGITLRQARSINICAKNSYDAIRAGGAVPQAAGSQTRRVPADTHRANKAGSSSVSMGGNGSICPANYTGMYRGSLYCRDGVLRR